MDDIKVATYEQIATLLSQLMNNYSNMINSYYDMFYNTNLMDINLQLYNDNGELKDYTIPNRAKDFNFIRNGQGSPEGVVIAPIGTTYQDTLNGDLYIKQIGSSFDGWLKVSGIAIDNVPTYGSNNAVSSGAVYNALQEIQDSLGDIEQQLKEING